MKLPQAPTLWLLVLLALELTGCGERLSQPRLERVLAASWQSYRQQFISPEGRVVLPERDGGTISEAQAYALLRAVWAGDEATFVRVYAWTVNNLCRPDHLLAWHWGRRPDGSWGVLDANTASDGDLDYALALILAARRGWRAPPDLPDYRAQAREVLAAILEKEVVALPGGEAPPHPGELARSRASLSPQSVLFFPGGVSAVRPNRRRPCRGGSRAAPTRLPPGRGDLSPGAAWNRLHQDTYQLLEVMNQGLGASPGWGCSRTGAGWTRRGS